jgi:hypothetical protein
MFDFSTATLQTEKATPAVLARYGPSFTSCLSKGDSGPGAMTKRTDCGRKYGMRYQQGLIVPRLNLPQQIQ